MEYFNIVDNNNGTITIISNTKWILSIDGNFNLSKLSSSGSTDESNQIFEINILLDEEEPSARGIIYYSFGIGYCKDVKSITISYTNPRFFYIDPSFVTLTGKGSTQIVNVHSNYEWHVTNSYRNNYIAMPYDNKIMVISTTENEFGTEDNPLTSIVSDLYNSQTLSVVQYSNVITGETKLSSSCDFNGKYNATISVISLINGNFTDFSYEVMPNSGITLVRVDLNTINVTIDENTPLHYWNINFTNRLKTNSLLIDNSSINNVNDVFYFIKDNERYGFYNGTQNAEYNLNYNVCNMNETLIVSAISENTITGEKYNWNVSSYDNEQLSVQYHDEGYYVISLPVNYEYNGGVSTIIFSNDKNRNIFVNCTLSNSLNGMCYYFDAVCARENCFPSIDNKITINVSAYDRNNNPALWSITRGVNGNALIFSIQGGRGDGEFNVSTNTSAMLVDTLTATFSVKLVDTSDSITFTANLNKTNGTIEITDITRITDKLCEDCSEEINTP